MQIKGTFSDGQTSHVHSAVLEVRNAEQLALITEQQNFTIHRSEISISSRLGNSARRLRLGEYGLFETDDNAAIDQMEVLLFGKPKSAYLHALETNIKLILLALLITPVVVFISFRYGVPALSDVIADKLPDRSADFIEQQVFEQIENEWMFPSTLSKERQATLQALFQEVLSKQVPEEAKRQRYRFLLRSGGDTLGANAIALPYGTIIMTDELVNIATDDRQLAGVMAHEIGHIQGNHNMRQLVRGSLLTFILAMISGDVSGASATIASAPLILVQLQYSREFEEEADQASLSYFECDTEGLTLMGDFFANLEVKLRQALLATHQQETHNGSVEGDDQGNQPETAENASNDAEQSLQRESLSSYLSSHPLSKTRADVFYRNGKRPCLDSN